MNLNADHDGNQMADKLHILADHLHVQNIIVKGPVNSRPLQVLVEFNGWSSISRNKLKMLNSSNPRLLVFIITSLKFFSHQLLA